MNRDYGFVVAIISFAISARLDYLYDGWIFIALTVVTGGLAIYETCMLGKHKSKQDAVEVEDE